MAWIDDIDILNDASSANADFTINSGFDQPTDNTTASTTPIYVEGVACAWMPLKKGITGGYNATAVITGTPTLTGRVVVGFLNYPFADVANIPITSFAMRLSSSTGFTTNYLEWNALTQLFSPENTPISGHTPIIGYEDAGTETGTFNGDCESVGWVATTGNSNDGKQGGFDWFFVIGYVGAHSATLNGTFFSGLQSEYYDNEGNGLPGETSRPIGVLSQAGNFFQTNINFQLGDGTSDTANLVVTEIGKTVFFNNLHINHSLGYVFVDPASTHEVRLTLTDCVHFWNDQSTSANIFTNANNATYFKVDGCSFSDGGKATLPSYSVNRWVKTSKFNACGVIDIDDGTFESNTISNATTGVFYSGTGTRRSKNNTYIGNEDALHFDTAQTVTVDGDVFVANDYDIHFSGTGTLTINAINGANPSVWRASGGGTVVINNTKTIDITVVDQAQDVIPGAVVFMEADSGGDLPSDASITITRSGSTATVTHTAHGYPTGQLVAIRDADQVEYKGIKIITITGVNTYTFTVTGTPTTPATGTITATTIIINAVTNASGEVVDSTFNYTSNQPIRGYVHKKSHYPLFKSAPLLGSIGVNGYTATIQMVSDTS